MTHTNMSTGVHKNTPASMFDAYQSKTFFGSLDGLRFFCIALVVWLHSPAYGAAKDFVPMILKRGHTGVDFFFVLSGFLITTILLREETRTGKISLLGFYRRRILRIFPLYFLIVLGIAAYQILAKGQDEYASMLPYYLLFIANMLKGDIPLLGPAWSLSVEEQFYLLWPLSLILLAGFKQIRMWVLAALILACALGSPDNYLSHGRILLETDQAYFGIHVRGFSAILIGALTALLLHHPASFALLWRIAGGRFAALIAIAALVLFYQLMPLSLKGWPYTAMHLLMAYVLISLVIREDHLVKPVMRFAPFVRIGQISYGLYLVHLIALHFANELIEQTTGWQAESAPWTASVVMVVLGVILAEISFRYYETPFLNLRYKTRKSAS